MQGLAKVSIKKAKRKSQMYVISLGIVILSQKKQSTRKSPLKFKNDPPCERGSYSIASSSK